MCKYHFPSISAAGETSTKPLVLFVFPTLDMSQRICIFDTHMWMDHVVQHATAVPVFVDGKRVTFGHHDRVSIEAWGGGKKYNQ